MHIYIIQNIFVMYKNYFYIKYWMNPKLFARAFSDIKKQSENEKSKKNITNR